MPVLKMPEREEGDGPVRVQRTHPKGVAVDVTTHGETETIHMSEFNAWRMLGALSLMLEVPLSKEAQRAIKM